jgi:1-deoxy-D-xylulose-5-phosphate synthase
MVVLNPKDENELQHMVYTAAKYDDGPIAVRFPRGTGLGVPMDEELQEIEIGTWEVLKEGKDIAILAVGTMIPVAMKAAEQLASKGISAIVVNARSIKPLDNGMITELVTKHIPILTMEEGILQGGFGSAVLEFVHDLGIHDAVIDRMGIPDRFIEHGSVSKLLEEIHLTPDGVVERVFEMIPKKQKRAY